MTVDRGAVAREVRRPILGKLAREALLSFVGERLPHLDGAPSRAAWERRARSVRGELLDLLFHGHPAGLLRKQFAVEWAGTARSGDGYRVRKVRFEGYPGLWVPALLYEPWPARGGGRALPAVLNPNGHHAGGKAMAYKQARCINLAKRGALALSFEFLGMGELTGMRHHNRIGHLDLVGVAGVGVFYLVMKRALDLLLAHPRIDRSRVAMTGLSGGGWQTILLSALDERITASIPVAGHTAVWQRIGYREDIGDLEQIPSDFCTVADYDVLSGMLAPRPSLFIYNHSDDCCFQTARARVSVIEPARRVFELLGAADRMETHDNTDPGTHNYERDSRRRFYAFLSKRFGLDPTEDDLPWEKELLTERECTVGLPAGNATLLSLATQRALALEAKHAAARRVPADSARARRRRAELAAILRLPRARVGSFRADTSRSVGGVVVARGAATVGGWSVPLARVLPPGASAGRAAKGRAAALPGGAPAEGAARLRFRGGEHVLAVSDGGREAALASVMPRCCVASGAPAPAEVVAADVYGTGELAVSSEEHMIVAATGERPLGIQVAHILALARWMRSGRSSGRVSLHASGLVTSIASLIAVALEPALFAELATDSLPVSLARLFDWPVGYEEAAPLFCFGLFEAFDMPELVSLCSRVPVTDPNRGPLQPREGRE